MMMVWVSVLVSGVMRSGGYLSLQIMFIEFVDEFDVVYERRKLKIIKDFCQNNWKDEIVIFCGGENRNKFYGKWMR